LILVDTALERREAAGRPILFGMFGAGFMARGIVNQGRYVRGVRCAAVCNRSVDKAADLLGRTGVSDIEIVTSAAALDGVIRRGGTGVTHDPAVLGGSELLECLLEATGQVEYGARVATLAIEHRKHLVLLNAELDGTVGPLLKMRADAAGTLISGCDGDQPAVEMNLYRFVKGIGLTPLVCGNVKGLQDRYRNPTTQESFARQWGQTPAMVTSFAVVANATGMKVARRGMIGPVHEGHVDELVTSFDLEQARALGGIVDYALGSRPSPGVFIFAEAHDDVQAHYLRYCKLGDGPLYSFYVPYHLLIFEVASSIARVVELGDVAIAPRGGPMVDVVAAAKVDLKAGQVIDGLGGYHTYGLCENHGVVRSEALLPIGLAEGAVVVRDIERDEVLGVDDVEFPSGTLIHRLRSEQDALFPVIG
jgi:predicted homoserine dehydrogenase-like protein